MKKFTKVLALVLVLVIFASFFAGCDKNKTVSKDGKVTVTIAAPNLDESMKDDEIYKFLCEKFNIEFEFIANPMDTMAEKGRLWVASGSVPDIMFNEFVYNDYLSWGTQGLVKPLPKDYKEKYPNLAEGLEFTMITPKLEEDGNGVIFGIPRSMTSMQIHGFSSDIPNLDRHGIVYRKDWAEKLGIETSTIMSYDDFIDMAVKFKEADLGGAGAANTMGLAVTSANAPFVFVHAQNPNWNVFYKNSKGKYVSGYNDAATLDGLMAYKEAYDLGVLHTSFYTHNASDVPNYFYSGKAGMFFTTCGASNFQTFKERFETANPGLNGDECIDVMWIEGKDGKVRAREMANYWSCLYFNPELDDEVFDRVLSLIDYLTSEEGSLLINAGFEGTDYKVEEDGTITRTLPPLEDGSTPVFGDVYPSTKMFSNLRIKSPFGIDLKKHNIQAITDFMQAKLDSDLETKKLDLDVEFYNTDLYSKFAATHDVATTMAELITGDEDVKKAWKSNVKSLQNKIDEVADEMNKNLN